jgi:hypothetical protein
VGAFMEEELNDTAKYSAKAKLLITFISVIIITVKIRKLQMKYNNIVCVCLRKNVTYVVIYSSNHTFP